MNEYFNFVITNKKSINIIYYGFRKQKLQSRTSSFALAHRFCNFIIDVNGLFEAHLVRENNVAAIIQENLKALNISINQEDAIKIAKKIRNPMWDWHIYSGYFLIGLYVLRLTNLYFSGIVFPNPFHKASSQKQKIQGWTYIIFYFLMAISLITGFFIVNGPLEYKDILETIHVQSIYYVVLFIIMHMAGLFISELSNEKGGIVAKMIFGK